MLARLCLNYDCKPYGGLKIGCSSMSVIGWNHLHSDTTCPKLFRRCCHILAIYSFVCIRYCPHDNSMVVNHFLNIIHGIHGAYQITQMNRLSCPWCVFHGKSWCSIHFCLCKSQGSKFRLSYSQNSIWRKYKIMGPITLLVNDVLSPKSISIWSIPTIDIHMYLNELNVGYSPQCCTYKAVKHIWCDS